MRFTIEIPTPGMTPGMTPEALQWMAEALQRMADNTNVIPLLDKPTCCFGERPRTLGSISNVRVHEGKLVGDVETELNLEYMLTQPKCMAVSFMAAGK